MSSSTSDKLRWGILGTGKIAEDFVVALTQPGHGAQFVVQAIGSRDQTKAEEFAKKFNIPDRHGSYESLVSNPNVDIIYVCTPDAQHAPHALLALRANKHVLVEKPFTESAASAQEVIELALEKKLFCMEALWTRFVPATVEMLRLVQEGTLGQITSVSSDFGCPFPIPSGALNAVGVYDLALHQMVFDTQSNADANQQQQPQVVNKPTKLSAVGILRPNSEVDDQVSAVVQYSAGQTGIFTASLLVDSHKEALICGTKGRVRMMGPLWHSTDEIIVELANNPTPQVVSFKGQEKGPFVQNFHLLNSERLVYQAKEVHECIRKGLTQSSKWTLAQTLQVMRDMENIRKQIRA